jgi:hemolysin activation/secretion protein
MKHPRIPLALLLSALGAVQPVQAQSTTLPDPSGELRRQDERTQALRQREEQAVDVKSPALPVNASRLPDSESPCFRIDHLQIHSTDNFDWLSKALAGPLGDDSAIGKCTGAKGIALLIKRAQDALLQRGLVTSRVLAEEQNLSNGTLSLTFVPGHVSAIRFKEAGSSGVRLYNAIPSHSGALLNLRDVEQGLENLKRVPTAEAAIQIEPAQDNAAPGQSDLVIS